MQTPHARTIHLTQKPKQNTIPPTPQEGDQGRNPGRLRIEKGAGFSLERMTGFIVIRIILNSNTNRDEHQRPN
jgi:hypothetical protein